MGEEKEARCTSAARGQRVDSMVAAGMHRAVGDRRESVQPWKQRRRQPTEASSSCIAM